MVRCELEVGDSHNFPPIPLPEWCNFFSQALSVARDTGKEGVSEKVLFTNFTQDSIPSFHGLMELSGTSYPTDFHDCITSLPLELNSHASIQPPLALH